MPIRSAVDRDDAALIELLVEHGAERDEDAHLPRVRARRRRQCRGALEARRRARTWVTSSTSRTSKGYAWFLDRGVDVNERCCLHHAIARGRSPAIIELILDGRGRRRPAVELLGRRPQAACACRALWSSRRLRAARVARRDGRPRRGRHRPCSPWPAVSRSPCRAPGRLRSATPTPRTTAGSSASSRSSTGSEIVRALLDAGWDVDTRGWSGFTPCDQAAMHGRREMVRFLVERGANLEDRAWGDRGPRPLDCVIWGSAATPPSTATTRARPRRSPLAARRPGTARRAAIRAVDRVLERHGIW